MSEFFLKPAGTYTGTSAPDLRFPVVSDDWQALLDDSAAYQLFSHALVPMFARLHRNLVVEFSKTSGRPVDDVCPYLNPTPLLRGLPPPFDRMLWRAPADLWASLLKFLHTVATVDVEHRFYSTVVAQQLPLFIGDRAGGCERSVVLVGTATTEGTFFFHPRPDGTAELRKGEVHPDVRRTADTLLGPEGQ